MIRRVAEGMNGMSWFQIFLTQDAKAYRAGDVVFSQGDPGTCMYVVADGEVEVAVGGKAVNVLRREAIFGELALIKHEARTATVTALTDCKLVEIGEKRFLYLVHETPNFALEVMRVLADRQRRHDPAS
jgi:CRP/FNR family transcriptional regulator, cyclic AMP receptor protein